MIARKWLVGLAAASVATATLAAQPAPTGTGAVAQKIAACEGEKFEFSAGDPRPTKITLCSDKGATTADLVRMFDSAATRIQQLDRLPQDRRAALVAQIKAKIAEVQARAVVAVPLPPAAPLPDYSPLPPLPSPVAPPVVATPAPMPARPALAAAPLLARPRLTFECSTPGEIGEGGPCVGFANDTLLAVRAGEGLPGGTSLRFVRRGDVRAEIALGQMRKGQSRRFRLPAELCAGVTGSKIEIQVVRSGAGAASVGQVVDTRGPYQLRC